MIGLKQSEAYLDRILDKDSLLSLINNSGLDEDLFVIIGRALVKDADEVYLTSHTPDECAPETSYRLWIAKPSVCPSGHPDWNPDLAVADMWKIRTPETDEEICSKIIGYNETANLTPEVVKTDGWFCKETRIYKIK